MLRVGLEDLILQILVLDLDEPSLFFSKALNPPSALALRNSLNLLEGLGAVDCQWKSDPKTVANTQLTEKGEIVAESCSVVDVKTELTALGYNLASLPVEPRVGKVMIYGAMFGKRFLCVCLERQRKTDFRNSIHRVHRPCTNDSGFHELEVCICLIFRGPRRSRQKAGGLFT